MKPFSIPVRTIGPGSQQDERDEPSCLGMPREMSTFGMPSVPEAADGKALVAARDTLASLVRDLERWNPKALAPGPTVDLSALAPAVVDIVNQVLGQGEVSIVISGARPTRVQESVFTGLWRVCGFDGAGKLREDRLETGSLPQVALDAAQAASAEGIAPAAVPSGAMNAPALLREIVTSMRQWCKGHPAHVINLTLLPLTPDDHALLEHALPIGPVAMISRGFGNCRITSTLARHVWRVQYFNNMNTLILDTIEVVGVPEVALAAVEDLDDTRARLAELVDWMSESCPA